MLTKYAGVDLEQVRRAKYLHDFDKALTSRVSGYPTVGSYHRDVSCVVAVLGVRIPLLSLNALDDPVSRSTSTVPVVMQSPFEG